MSFLDFDSEDELSLPTPNALPVPKTSPTLPSLDEHDSDGCEALEAFAAAFGPKRKHSSKEQGSRKRVPRDVELDENGRQLMTTTIPKPSTKEERDADAVYLETIVEVGRTRSGRTVQKRVQTMDTPFTERFAYYSSVREMEEDDLRDYVKRTGDIDASISSSEDSEHSDVETEDEDFECDEEVNEESETSESEQDSCSENSNEETEEVSSIPAKRTRLKKRATAETDLLDLLDEDSMADVDSVKPHVEKRKKKMVVDSDEEEIVIDLSKPVEEEQTKEESEDIEETQEEDEIDEGDGDDDLEEGDGDDDLEEGDGDDDLEEGDGGDVDEDDVDEDDVDEDDVDEDDVDEDEDNDSAKSSPDGRLIEQTFNVCEDTKSALRLLKDARPKERYVICFGTILAGDLSALEMQVLVSVYCLKSATQVSFVHYAGIVPTFYDCEIGSFVERGQEYDVDGKSYPKGAPETEKMCRRAQKRGVKHLKSLEEFRAEYPHSTFVSSDKVDTLFSKL